MSNELQFEVQSKYIPLTFTNRVLTTREINRSSNEIHTLTQITSDEYAITISLIVWLNILFGLVFRQNYNAIGCWLCIIA